MDLQDLDTVIAFVAVMSGVCLIITSLTQMASALMGLRGRHLRWGLEALLKEIDPQLRERASAVTEALLTHPLVSDSMFARRLLPVRRITEGLFGKLWRGWKYATAIRVTELKALIEKLATGVGAVEGVCRDALEAIARLDLKDAAGRRAAAQQLQRALEVLERAEGLDPFWKARLEEVRVALGPPSSTSDNDSALHGLAPLARGLIDGLLGMHALQATVASHDAQIEERSRKLRAELATLPAAIVSGPDFRKCWETDLNKTRDDFVGWFDATMDRVSQHFASHLRVWTIAFSLGVALLFQLDAVALYRRLASDSELRAMLVANAAALRDRVEVAQSTTHTVASLHDVLKGTLTRPGGGFTNLLVELEKVPAFADVTAATNWVVTTARQLGRSAPSPMDVDRAVAAFQRDVELSPFLSAMNRFQSAIEDRGIVLLIPKPFHWPWQVAFWAGIRDHFAGILVSTVFLSLGAPFWFNLLKNLSTLRPILANKQKAESE